MELNGKNPLSTILISITLGVLSFVAYATFTTAVDVASLNASQITRPELETKLTEIRVLNAATEVEVTALNVSVVKLQAQQYESLKK